MKVKGWKKQTLAFVKHCSVLCEKRGLRSLNVNWRKIRIKYLQTYLTLTLLAIRQHKNLQKIEVFHPTEKNITCLCDKQKATDQKMKKNSGYRGTSAYDVFIYRDRIKLRVLVNATFGHCPLKLKVKLLSKNIVYYLIWHFTISPFFPFVFYFLVSLYLFLLFTKLPILPAFHCSPAPLHPPSRFVFRIKYFYSVFSQ